MINSLQLHYRKLPRNWADVDVTDYNISTTKLSSILVKIERLPDKAIQLYVQEGIGLIVNKTFDKVKYFGVDFTKYFDSSFDKNSEPFEVPSDADVVVIYNVGYEKALNMDFSSRLLKGLLKQIKDANKHCFIGSDMTYTEFYKKYNIEFVNKVVIKTKEDEKIF